MPTPLTRTLSTLAILLVACAQIFGMDRGFLCDCGGVEKVTRVDHCHGPHSAACHDDETLDHAITSHHHHHGSATETEKEDHDHDHDGDSHEHQAFIESLLATASLASASAPAFTAVLLAELPSFDPILILSATAAHTLSLNHPLHLSSSERPPPASLQVARCIVLRV